jgi:hypothetical protein
VGKVVTQSVVIAEGAQPLPRGTVLGQQSNVTVESAAGANNGNGTIGALSAGTGVEIGTYTLTATDATTFTVATPERVDLANATLGTACAKGGIGFTITGGDAAFGAGDSFAVTVVNSVGTFVPCIKTASEWFANPSCDPGRLC